mmetsp:Transcript_12905/g.18860  ORF Transcript_12905/g.18860 Transcript_12905/m.18860 type:complete len:82 (+) Transcript_12905:79-324(+)
MRLCESLGGMMMMMMMGAMFQKRNLNLLGLNINADMCVYRVGEICHKTLQISFCVWSYFGFRHNEHSTFHQAFYKLPAFLG